MSEPALGSCHTDERIQSSNLKMRAGRQWLSLQSDTPPPLPKRIMCHRNGTPFRNVVHMATQAAHTSPCELLLKLPPRSSDTEAMLGEWMVGGGWRVEGGGQLTRHAHRHSERERETEKEAD